MVWFGIVSSTSGLGCLWSRLCIGRFNDTIDGRVRPRRPEVSLVWFGVALATSGASDQGVMGVVYGRAFAWPFQWHHRRPCPTSAAGYITVFLWQRFYPPAMTSSHEIVHTDIYTSGGRGGPHTRLPYRTAVTSSESSFLFQCRPLLSALSGGLHTERSWHREEG